MKTAKPKPLPPTQQAALERLKRDGQVNWSSTSTAEARAFNALVAKGLVRKIIDHRHRYELV